MEIVEGDAEHQHTDADIDGACRGAGLDLKDLTLSCEGLKGGAHQTDGLSDTEAIGGHEEVGEIPAIAHVRLEQTVFRLFGG